MYDRATIAEESIKDRYDKYIAEYAESMRAAIVHEQEIVNIMDEALSNGEFEPWFQPQYNHATGAVIGSEALVRWKRNGVFISPAEFVPVFERNGFIYEMDRFIWEEVCKDLRRWINEGLLPIPVSVNVSRRDLFHEECVSVLDGLIKKYDLPYELLRIEVTESAFSESSKHIVNKVAELIKLGFTVEIDDFGSGYSSLNTLKDVPADILKLDMKFFENTVNTQRGGNIVESVVRMAKWLGMAVIAEGVEEKAQADYLKSIGCYYIQGYFYSKPIPMDKYEELLDSCHKEHKLMRLKTLDTLDNSEFWNPKSMETLIFNSYVGGACIFEYHNKKLELLRVNDRYSDELGYFKPENSGLEDRTVDTYLDDENKKMLTENIEKAINSKTESTCEMTISDNYGHVEYLRTTVRVIAKTDERYLLYGVIVNTTEQKVAEQKRHEAEQKEMQSAQQLQIIMSNINGGVSAIRIFDNGKSQFVFNNEKYYELFGYTREQIEAENIDVMTLILPEDFESVMKKVKRLKQNRIPTIIDYRCIKKDGKLAYLRANSSMMSINGYDDVIASVVTDITEQKEMEEQLEAIVDNINGGVAATVLINGTPQFVVVNTRFYEILGYTKEQYEAECTDKYSQIHPDDREKVVKKFEEASKNMTPRYSMEYRVIRRDGVVRYIQNNVSVINIFGIDEPVQLAVMNDITELRMAERQVAGTNDRLRAVMNSAGNGITAVVIYKDRTELLFANDKFFEIIGYSRKMFRDNGIKDSLSFIHPDDIEMVKKMANHNTETMKNKTFEYRVIRPDGKIVWIKNIVRITNLIGIDAPVQITVFSDITAEKSSDEQLRFLNDTAHDILKQTDCVKAIDGTLRKLLAFFDGDRSYIIELDYSKQVSNNSYEICAAGVTSEKDKLKNVPFEVSAIWFEKLNNNQFVVIDEVSEIEEKEAELRELLLSQGIRSLIVAPLWRDGVLIGFAGIDNPRKAHNQRDRLMALGDYLAILLTRRDLNQKIKNEIEEQKKIADSLRITEMEYRIATKHSGRIICRYNIADRTLSFGTEAAKRLELPEIIEDVPYGRVKLGKISPETSKDYIAFYESIIRGEKECKVVFDKLLPTGWRRVSAHATTIFSEEDKPVSAVISYVDITDKN